MPNSPFPSYHNLAHLAANVPNYDQRAIEILTLPEVQELVNRVINLSESNFNGQRHLNVTTFTLFCRAANDTSLPHALSPRRDSYSPVLLSPPLRELLNSDATSVHPSGSPPYFDCSGSSMPLSGATWPASLDTWPGPLTPLCSLDLPDFSSLNSQLDPAQSEYRDILGISTSDTGTMVNAQSSIGALRVDLAFVDDYIQLLFAQTPPPDSYSVTIVRALNPLDLLPSQDTPFDQFIDYDAMEMDLET
ncbi:hypothetical protein BDN71DRAFT_1510736 [Pleurotus eryngii]|uniref:Uncharacterized protein n=1 Tax=Pleurotus eryngii TaxID=5323 RepID=A0A9P5ZNE5_PLEER|nr:hypothetical protein BDN71DRAFT_1510736 [Pleurotus eryngii]